MIAPALPARTASSAVRRRAASVLALLAAVALAGGCTGGHHANSSAHGLGAQAGGDAAAREPAKAAAPNTGSKDQLTTANAPLQHRDIVRTATISIRTGHVDRTADAVASLAGRANGRVDRDDRSSRRGGRIATLVLRVPPQMLDRIIRSVDSLGREISRSVRGQDVTASRADIEARTAALQTSVKRLRGFLSHSGSINSLVSLERQLTERESELESMQAQQRALADKIALATLTVHVSETRHPAAVPKPHATSIAGSFVSGWHALSIAARWVAMAVGYSLPVAVAVLLIAGFGLAFLRRRHHGTQANADT